MSKLISKADVEAAKAPLMEAGGFFELCEYSTARGVFAGYKNAPSSVIDILQAGRAHGDNEFIVYEEDRWTFNEFFRRADGLRAQLLNQYQMQPGDRVAIAMRNYPEWLVAFTAIALSGGVAVPLNSWGKLDELMYGIEDSQAKIVFCDGERYQLIADQIESIAASIIVARQAVDAQLHPSVNTIDELINNTTADIPDIAEVDPNATATILYTSGSTGYPKGVMLTHRALGQCLMNMYFGGALATAFADPKLAEDNPPPSSTLITVPFFHGTGLWGSFFVPLQMGQKIVLMHKWDAAKGLVLIESEAITNFISVPAIVRSILTHNDFTVEKTSTLRVLSMAGAATPPDLPPMITQKLPKAGRSTGWGMTENCAVGTSMGGLLYDQYPEGAGLLSPVVQLRMVDNKGNVLAEGEEGEIECRSIANMPGYWRNTDATVEVFHDDWLRTGDVGRFNDCGVLHITGRVKEIVIRGGENIFPGEVEDVAYQLDWVQEVVVFGVPDNILGEELVMIFYAGDNSAVADIEQLRSHLAKSLAGFKVPKTIQDNGAPLPLNVSNKLNKKALRQSYIDLLS